MGAVRRRHNLADPRRSLVGADSRDRAEYSSSAPGLALILKTSMWAKRHYVRVKRWQPKAGRWMDWALRRPSAKRREALRKADSEPAQRQLTSPRLSTIGAHDSGCLFGRPFFFRI